MKMAFSRCLYTFSNSILSSTITSKLPIKNINRKTLVILSKNLASQNTSEKKEIKIKFIKNDGKNVEVTAKVGDNLCETAMKHNIFQVNELCIGLMGCPDCHVILTEKDYEKLYSSHEEDEEIVFHIKNFTETSRMSCRIKLTEDLDGMEFEVPEKQKPL